MTCDKDLLGGFVDDVDVLASISNTMKKLLY